MGSTAALMQGLQSFDSSDAGGASHAVQGAHHALNQTVGGITFGSVAESFHSEEMDQERAVQQQFLLQQQQQERRQRGRVGENGDDDDDEQEVLTDEKKWKGNHQDHYEEESLMEEKIPGIMSGSPPPHLGQDQDEVGITKRRSNNQLKQTTSTIRSTSSMFNSKSTSSRIPSTSTAPTEPPPPTSPVTFGTPAGLPPSAIVDLSGQGVDGGRHTEKGGEPDNSGRFLRDLNWDDNSNATAASREVGSGAGQGRYAANRALGAGAAAGVKKKKEKSSVPQSMTLREQEQVIDEYKKENFDLKLKISFYQQRLESLAPDQMDQALQENIQLKVEFQNLLTELKRYKKLLIEGDKVIKQLTAEREDLLKGKAGVGLGRGRERELDRELDKMRKALESERKTREDLENELKKKRKVDEYEGEDARAEISRLRSEIDAEREAREDVLAERDELRNQLRDTSDMLEEAQEDLTILKAQHRRALDESSISDGTDGDRRTSRKDLINERDKLKLEVESLTQDIYQLENEVEEHEKSKALRNRDLSRSSGTGEAKDLEIGQLEKALVEKESEVEVLLQDLDDRDADHLAELKQIEEEFRQEIQDAKARETEARDLLEEKEADVEDLAAKVEALSAELADREADMGADAEEVEALTDDLKKLGAQIFALEEELDQKEAKIQELEVELYAVDKEIEDKELMHEDALIALNEKVSTHRNRHEEMALQHESALAEAATLRQKVEQLSHRTNEVEDRSRSEMEIKKRLEEEADNLMQALRKEEEERHLDQQEWSRQRREAESKWQKLIESKESSVVKAQSDVERFQNLLKIREEDLQKLQDTLNGLSRHSSEQSAAGLELERIKRDLTRCSEDLERSRKELQEQAEALRSKDMSLAAMKSEKKDLAAQLAAQTQARLSFTEKYDSTVKSLREAQQELGSSKSRLRLVEDQLSHDHSALSKTESSYREELGQRNTLLLTVYQYMEKMVGQDRSPRKTDPKPLSNFPVFSENLILRVKSVNQIHTSFDRRTKDVEANYLEKFDAIKKQQDSRMRQLDRLESALKTATDTQRQWRQRVNLKQTEVEAAKATNTELQAQIASIRQRASIANADPDSASKISSLATRASTAERRLVKTQAQLESAEQKLEEARQKVTVAESKWEARLKELEARLRASEEKTKRERQGAKERVAELSNTVKDLEGQVAGARRRDHQLEDVIEMTERQKREEGLER